MDVRGGEIWKRIEMAFTRAPGGTMAPSSYPAASAGPRPAAPTPSAIYWHLSPQSGQCAEQRMCRICNQYYHEEDKCKCNCPFSGRKKQSTGKYVFPSCTGTAAFTSGSCQEMPEGASNFVTSLQVRTCRVDSLPFPLVQSTT